MKQIADMINKRLEQELGEQYAYARPYDAHGHYIRSNNSVRDNAFWSTETAKTVVSGSSGS